jgi:tetratricopeptide (TPR) repeat protein
MTSFPNANRSSARDRDQDSPNLQDLLEQLAVIVKRADVNRHELRKQLAEMQMTLDQAEREELNGPVDNWDHVILRLPHMKRASKRGEFDQYLECSWSRMNAFLNSTSREQRARFEKVPEYWKTRTLIHELNEIFRRDVEINQRVYDDGHRVIAELKLLEKNWESAAVRRDRQSPAFLVLIREKVLFCLCFGNELKRRGETEEAAKRLRWLLDFTERNLKTDAMQCFGTRAALSYGLATIFRNLEFHREAREYYTKSLDLYFARAKKRGPNDHDDIMFTTRRIAMCIGLGFGWISLTRGYLRRAENALTTARALLAQAPHSLVDYIEFLYGNIKRCRAGSEKKELEDAIVSLKLARTAFEDQGHGRYETRAARELALAYNLTGDFEKALALAGFTENMALQEGNLKGQVNACVLRSRILRNQGKYRIALAEAERGLKMIRDAEDPLPEVDALIARGESRLYLAARTNEKEATYDEARGDFTTANEMLFIEDYDTGERQLRNPKIAAVCELRIAQCYARAGNRGEAEDHFAVFKGLRTRVEHGWVRELGREVRSEIDKLTGNFVITTIDPARFDREAMFTKLDNWMTEQALSHTRGNVTEAAALMHLSKATVHRARKRPTRKRVRIGKRKE